LKKLLTIFLLVNVLSAKAQFPVAAFSVDDTTICGSCINFTNLSLNATSYHWSFPGASPNSSTAFSPSSICYFNPGTYNVTLIATNSNGSDTLTMSNYITVYPYPPLSLYTHGDTIFANQGLFHYQWYLNSDSIPNDTNYYCVALHDGTHFVVVTDTNGCQNSPATFGPIFLPDFTPSDTDFCSGTCIDFTNTSQFSSGDSAFITLQWYFDGGSPSTSQDFSPQNICYSNAGNYLVKFIMLEGIDSRSDSFTVNVLNCTGVLENSFSPQQLFLSPTPFSTNITLHFTEAQKESAELSVFNSIGELVFEKEILTEDQILCLVALPRGIYLVRVRSVKGVFTEKVTKE